MSSRSSHDVVRLAAAQAAFRVVLEHHQAQRRQAEIQGVLVAVDAPPVRWFASHVAEVAAAVFGCIGVEDLLVEAGERASYNFKFIVATESKNKVISLLPDAKRLEKKSSNGKYTSVTLT